MSKKSFAKWAVFAVALSGALVILAAELPAGGQAGSGKECLKDSGKQKETGADKTVWESLPQQIFSSI